MTSDDDHLPSLPPLLEALLRAEQRRPPPAIRERRALWRRTRATLMAGGLVPTWLAGGRASATVLSAKTAVALIGVVVASMGVGAVLGRSGIVQRPAPPPSAPVLDRRPPPPPPAPVRPVASSLPRTLPFPPHSPAPSGTPRLEAPLIDQARSALASGDVSTAAVALARHARHFPEGTLAEERDALRVLCLAHAGQPARALTAAARFRTRYPRSLFLQLVNDATPAP
jgi:hypothetical protein